MTNKKLLSALLTVGLSTSLVACGSDTDKAEAPATETATNEAVTTEDVENEDVAVEPAPASEGEAGEGEEEVSGEAGIYDLDFAYLPEDFVENFKDEKKDLRTVEYTAEKNPAKKITIQISDNDERVSEIVTVPEDAEDITIGEDTGKFWDDGSFNYICVKRGNNTIYTRSTLEKDEAAKIVEEIK